MRLVLVPRWSGTGDSDYYPWLLQAVQARFTSVQIATLLPEPSAVAIGPSVAHLSALLEADIPTLVLGHSVGCQLILRTLAARDPGCVLGCLLVAAWLRLDEPWDEIRPWTVEPFEMGEAAKAAGEMRVLLSDNDPFTKDHEATRLPFEWGAKARVRVIPGAKHFNRSEEPEVLSELESLLSSVAT